MSRILFCAALAAVVLVASVASAASWKVKFDLANLDGLPGDAGRASFVVQVNEEWAPLGAARFKELVASGYFKGVRFFRNVKGFVTQFGLHGDPKVNAKWQDNKLKDDPVKTSNKRGTISFATAGENTRSNQLFINLGDNGNLDGMKFSPLAEVAGDGMGVVDRIYLGYGEQPSQGTITSEGNKYLKKSFPRLTYIEAATILNEDL